MSNKNDKWNGLPTIIMGTSGISKEVKTIIDEINNNNYCNHFNFLGYVGENSDSIGSDINGEKVISYDEKLEEFISKYREIGVVIPLGTPEIKEKIYKNLQRYSNIVFPNIISPRSNIMDINSVELGKGNIICAGVTLTCNIILGDFNLININSTIGHDVEIGDFCVINPITSVSGNVKLRSKVLLGAGSIVKQGLEIGESAIVGLGAFVVKDVKAGAIMVCESAKDRGVK